VNETLGYWFGVRGADGEVRLPHGDSRIVRAGETLEVTGEIRPCSRGLHASTRAIDALWYAPRQSGVVVCRVALSGVVKPHGDPVDKHAASHRRVLWMADADKALRLFAIECGIAALLLERHYGREPDPRSWDALIVAMRVEEGRATVEERRAAYAYAAAAAAASSSAAYAAAYASSSAAYAAAYAASSATYAASSAAYAAAAAARRSVRAFTLKRQDSSLTQRLSALEPKP